ncbi:MAG: hypothetical protein WC817_04140 [Patescibacteria group bacterium]|jgi:hypothetical protein
MEERFIPEEHLVGVTRDAHGNADKSRAVTMHVDAAAAAKAKDQRNVETVRNLGIVFGEMALEPDDQHLVLMLQEQGPLITKYLRETLAIGEGDEVRNQLAPGAAMLGFEMARSGFGRQEENAAADNIDNSTKREQAVAQKRYQAAENLFTRLMDKMYPDDAEPNYASASIRHAELPKQGACIASLLDVQYFLNELEAKGGPPRDKMEMLKYQSRIDLLIQHTGEVLAEAAETNAKQGVEGTMNDEVQENNRGDMLLLARALRVLQEKRRESVRYKYQSRAYDAASPSVLHKMEASEREHLS